MLRFSLPALTFFMFFPASLKAFDEAKWKACFESVTKMVEPSGFAETGYYDQPHLIFENELEGQHGGKIFKYQKPADRPWFSTYKRSPKANLGDPRMMIALLGEEAASYLGFKIDQNQFYGPSATEFQNVLDKIYSILPNYGYKLQFYQNTVSSDAIWHYNKSLVFDDKIPVFSNPDGILHEYWAHFNNVFLPDYITGYVKDMARASFKAKEIICNSKKLTKGQQKEMELHLDALTTDAIDYLLGKLAIFYHYIFEIKAKTIGELPEFQRKYKKDYTFTINRAFENFEDILSQLANHAYASNYAKQEIKAFPNLDSMMVEVYKHIRMVPEKFNRKFELSALDYCLETERKRLAFIGAIGKLQSESK